MFCASVYLYAASIYGKKVGGFCLFFSEVLKNYYLHNCSPVFEALENYLAVSLHFCLSLDILLFYFIL